MPSEGDGPRPVRGDTIQGLLERIAAMVIIGLIGALGVQGGHNTIAYTAMLLVALVPTGPDVRWLRRLLRFDRD